MIDWLPDNKLPDATTRRGSFLFLVGVILNQNISGELAWRGVARLSERVDLRPERLAGYPVNDLADALRRPPAIHPFATAMSHAISDAGERVCRQYRGDTRRLWRDTEKSDDIAVRLTRFRQIGHHKAEVAIFLLTSVYGELDTTPHGIAEACPSLLTYLDA